MAADPRNGQPGDALDDFLAQQQAGGSGDMPPLPPGAQPTAPQSEPPALVGHLGQHFQGGGAMGHASIGIMAVLGLIGRKWEGVNGRSFVAEGRVFLLALAIPAALGRRVWGTRPATLDPRRAAAHDRKASLAQQKTAGLAVKPKDLYRAELAEITAESFALLGEAFGPLAKVLKWALIAFLWLMFAEMEISLIGANSGSVPLFGPVVAICFAALAWWLGHKRARHAASLGIRGTFAGLFRGGPLGEGGQSHSGVAESIANGSWERYQASRAAQGGLDPSEGVGGDARSSAAPSGPRWNGRGPVR